MHIIHSCSNNNYLVKMYKNSSYVKPFLNTIKNVIILTCFFLTKTKKVFFRLGILIKLFVVIILIRAHDSLINNIFTLQYSNYWQLVTFRLLFSINIIESVRKSFPPIILGLFEINCFQQNYIFETCRYYLMNNCRNGASFFSLNDNTITKVSNYYKITKTTHTCSF